MTVEKLKDLFIMYDGSLFSMARENKEAYESLKSLNISEETLEKWRQEMFCTVSEQIKENGSCFLFNRMYNLSEGRHNKENLLIMRDALYRISTLDIKEKACISETVLGRKDVSEKSGLVFWAYALGEQDIAKELLRYVMRLLAVQTNDEQIRTRLERLMQKSNLIWNMIQK